MLYNKFMLDFFAKLLFPSISGRGSVSQQTESKIKAEWQNIDALLKQKSPSQLKQALISADKCLDNALRDVVAGETMGERLKNAKNKFDVITYNKIWEAHKVRNNLVHEAGYEPPYFVIQQAVDNLKNGLIVLGLRV
ncbi:MAG TPA: hypothetical protein VLI92_02975 [Candidatus Saccharimonadales bacterium]|nr:hypothetical protein [Candidatus Saccharimonadales bacterium]